MVTEYKLVKRFSSATLPTVTNLTLLDFSSLYMVKNKIITLQNHLCNEIYVIYLPYKNK